MTVEVEFKKDIADVPALIWSLFKKRRKEVFFCYISRDTAFLEHSQFFFSGSCWGLKQPFDSLLYNSREL